MMRPQLGDRGQLAVDALGLGVVRDAEGDRVMVGLRLKVSMLLGAILPHA